MRYRGAPFAICRWCCVKVTGQAKSSNVHSQAGHTKKAVKTLAAIMNEPRAPYAARVAAAEALLDRGWGKPKQSHEAEITHRYVIEIPALMDNAAWEAEAIEHEPDKLQRAS